ncbi:bifunctional metallophosphatase/5'-nucleotidase [Streptomyces sp. NTH33]|nr:bifunctional metallophosphatase/5'-nucleotidase [Streptomyces sp. NTH33]
MNQLDMKASSVGNHEFDKGYKELERIQNGGCSPVDGCRFDHPYRGARFRYLGANVTFKSSGENALPPYWIQRVNGVPVGFIGEPLQDTPSVTSPSGTAGLRFGDEVTTANRYADLLSRKGVKTIVLLLHQGDDDKVPNGPNTCDVAGGGPGTAIATRVSPKIDVVFSAHTHQQYVCWVKDPTGHRRPFVQGRSYGRELSVVDLRIDPRTHDVLRGRTQAFNRIVTRDVPKDPKAEALISRAVDLAAPTADKPVGRISQDIDTTPVGESPIGDVVADAQLAATTSQGAQIALVDPGDLRASLTYRPPTGTVTYGDAYAVQPFDNTLMTMSLTGAQLKAVLEQAFPNRGNRPLLLIPSANMRYTWSQSAPAGSKITSITVNGQPVQPTATYRVTVNDFLARGGDGFTVFPQGTNVTSDGKDLAAFTACLGAHEPLAPPPLNRIAQTA